MRLGVLSLFAVGALLGMVFGLAALSCGEDRDSSASLQTRDPNWFECADPQDENDDSRQTIPRSYICDGYPDCENGRDEVSCGGEDAARRRERAASTGYMWYCDDRQTRIHVDFRCDGIPDCLDGADELTCPFAAMPVCRLPRDCFMCTDVNGDSVLVDDFTADTCDGEEHCPDGADESPELCGASPESQSICRACFECADGQRIRKSGKTCNYKQDCDDNSDESDLCNPTSDELDDFYNFYQKDVCMACFACENGEQIEHVGFRCDLFDDCADGSDEKDCELDSFFFECENREKTIPKKQACDLKVDCTDGSDEIVCPDATAVCHDGKRIPLHWICDNVRDCADGEDETDCIPCRSEECYLCATLDDNQAKRASACERCPESERCSLCVHSELYRAAKELSPEGEKWKCDSVPHCSDWSDEIDCPDYRQGTEVFACESGHRYIPMGRKCDLVPDCPDYSDENKVNCPDFECDDGAYVAFSLVCNGVSDCSDESDEANCFACASELEYIAAEKRCDGWPDCQDVSDEDDCADAGSSSRSPGL